MSEKESNYDPNKRIKAVCDMTDGLVALFEDFMLRNEYEEALNVICDCYTAAPTSFVISEIIFKIMVNCDSKLCSKALSYLEQSLKLMPNNDDHKYTFIEGLKQEHGPFEDVWGAFDHFVLSTLHHRKISDGYDSLQEYIKHPNCDYLVQIYVKAFLRGPFKSAVFETHPEEKFSSLVKWINVFYKYESQMCDVVKNLHLLLDHIIELELSNDPEIPKWDALNKYPISQYIVILLNSCKDVFHLESQQRFFNLTESPHLILIICKHRLDDMLVRESIPRNTLTLKTIVEDYFFDKPKQTIEQEQTKKQEKEEPKSPRKSKKRKKSMTPSKSPKFVEPSAGTSTDVGTIQLDGSTQKPKKVYRSLIYKEGDTDFHVHCRTDRYDNLLEALYGDQSRDINAKNALGITPLHEACRGGSYLGCKFLMEEAGARRVDYRATDNEGRTPLHFAVIKKAQDVVNLLLKRAGPDLTKYRDHKGFKPIDYCQSEEMRKILHEAELQWKPSDAESQKKSTAMELKLPDLKSLLSLPLYLRTLRSLIGTYCEIHDIESYNDVTEDQLRSHDDEECFHFKVSADDTWCMEDYSTFPTMVENIKKLATCVRCMSIDIEVKRELQGLDILTVSFL